MHRLPGESGAAVTGHPASCKGSWCPASTAQTARWEQYCSTKPPCTMACLAPATCQHTQAPVPCRSTACSASPRMLPPARPPCLQLVQLKHKPLCPLPSKHGDSAACTFSSPCLVQVTSRCLTLIQPAVSAAVPAHGSAAAQPQAAWRGSQEGTCAHAELHPDCNGAHAVLHT